MLIIALVGIRLGFNNVWQLAGSILHALRPGGLGGFHTGGAAAASAAATAAAAGKTVVKTKKQERQHHQEQQDQSECHLNSVSKLYEFKENLL